ncbi:DUF1049 domain-containing protein [Bacillus carboniphilus]|uniref:DUF1049 domain-containing protein n=1 Tax=Bacillus carboniphilus TaxID=86663 RepID=A0ABN0WEC2_9BACI
MKQQGMLIASILFALIVAIFAVVNVESVRVNYLFGYAEWPLILIILGSVLMGGLILGTVGFFRYYSLQKKYKLLNHDYEKLKHQLDEGQSDVGIQVEDKTNKENS